MKSIRDKAQVDIAKLEHVLDHGKPSIYVLREINKRLSKLYTIVEHELVAEAIDAVDEILKK